MSQVSSETDPVALLPKVISLLYIQVSGLLPSSLPLCSSICCHIKTPAAVSSHASGAQQGSPGARKGDFCSSFKVEGRETTSSPLFFLFQVKTCINYVPQDKLPDATYKTLMDYHTATVTLLALLAAATGEVSRPWIGLYPVLPWPFMAPRPR